MTKYYKEIECSIFNSIIGRDDIVISLKTKNVYYVNKKQKCTLIGVYTGKLVRYCDEQNIPLDINKIAYSNNVNNTIINILNELKDENYMIQFQGKSEIISLDNINLEWVS